MAPPGYIRDTAMLSSQLDWPVCSCQSIIPTILEPDEPFVTPDGSLQNLAHSDMQRHGASADGA